MNRMVWEAYGFASEEEYRCAVKCPYDLVLDQDREWIEKQVGGLVLDGDTTSYIRQGVCRMGVRYGSAWSWGGLSMRTAWR